MASRFRSAIIDFSKLFIVLSLSLTPRLMAQDPEDPPGDPETGRTTVSVGARTVFPLYLGAGLQLHATPQLRLGLDIGKTPAAYAEAIGSAATHMKGQSQYKPTLVAAFSNNSLYRVYLRYSFSPLASRGWAIEFGLSQISSRGEEKVSDIGRVSVTGRDYKAIESSISALGYRPYVTMKTRMVWADFMGMYQWDLPHSLHAAIGAGLARVTGAEVDLSTEIPRFDSSATGMALLDLAESDLSSGIERYGLSPVLSLDIAYVF